MLAAATGSRLKPLVLCLAALLAQVAAGQTPGVPASLPVACTPWVVPVDATLSDPVNVPAAFGSASLGEFQGEWRKRLAAPTLNPAFPHARLYARSFETGAVAYLYERAVFQADPSALAVLIRLQESTLPAIQSDARAALAFIHFQLDTQAGKERGLGLIQEARKGDNSYPATVFWARAHAWGGDYASKNLRTAMGHLAEAGRLADERQSAGRRMDSLNLQEAHAETLRHLLAHEPELPHRSAYEGALASAAQVEKLQFEFMQEFERTSALAAVNKALQELDAVLTSPATASVFRLAPTTSRATGFMRLQEVLERQEQVAQAIHGLPPATDDPRQSALAPLKTANEHLVTALEVLNRQILFEQMADRSAFPQVLRRVKAMTAIQRGLSRSCSLAVTWGAARN